jgi:hypothetical protein
LNPCIACLVHQANLHGSAVTVKFLKMEFTTHDIEKEAHVMLQTRHPALDLFMGFTYSPAMKQFGFITQCGS